MSFFSVDFYIWRVVECRYWMWWWCGGALAWDGNEVREEPKEECMAVKRKAGGKKKAGASKAKKKAPARKKSAAKKKMGGKKRSAARK
jgi:hypothetical protein